MKKILVLNMVSLLKDSNISQFEKNCIVEKAVKRFVRHAGENMIMKLAVVLDLKNKSKYDKKANDLYNKFVKNNERIKSESSLIDGFVLVFENLIEIAYDDVTGINPMSELMTNKEISDYIDTVFAE